MAKTFDFKKLILHTHKSPFKSFQFFNISIFSTKIVLINYPWTLFIYCSSWRAVSQLRSSCPQTKVVLLEFGCGKSRWVPNYPDEMDECANFYGSLFKLSAIGKLKGAGWDRFVFVIVYGLEVFCPIIGLL
jgi:hypothetical protein